jgi:hypothetical protein
VEEPKGDQFLGVSAWPTRSSAEIDLSRIYPELIAVSVTSCKTLEAPSPMATPALQAIDKAKVRPATFREANWERCYGTQ